MKKEELTVAKKYFVNRACHHDNKYPHRLVQNRKNFDHTHIGPSFTLVFDYIYFRPVYVEETFMQVTGGYQPANLVAGGWGFLEQIILPEDMACLQLVLKKWNEFLFAIPVQARHDYHMSFDFRIRKRDGSIARLLQQNMRFEFDTQGNLIYSLDKCTDISHWKMREEMVLSIIGPDPAHSLTYYPKQDISPKSPLFTKSELRVLKLLVEGYGSKEIAAKLCLAVTTIETHRKRMLRKSKSKNASELVRYALVNKAI